MVTFAKLRTGAWGLRGPNLQPGQLVEVEKRDGSRTRAYVGAIVWHGADADLAEIATADVATQLRAETALAAAALAIGERTKTDFDSAPQPAGVAVELFPFQRAGVAFLSRLDHALLCDEMGLGKTLQAIGWAAAEPTGTEPVSQYADEPGRCRVCGRKLMTKDAALVGMGPICAKRAGQGFNYKKRPERTSGTIVVCPASVKYAWEREIKRARPTDRVVVVGEERAIPAPGEADWIVINYDLLSDRKVRSNGSGSRVIPGAVGALRDFAAHNLILDESHYIKNQKAARTEAALDLAAETPRRLMVTGTPLLNRPIELWTQLLAAGVKDKRTFFPWAKKYCDAKQVWAGRTRGMVWDFSGASNLDQLHESLKPFYVRRLKKDVLRELPPLLYTDDRVDLDNSDDYDEAQEHFAEWYAKRGRYAGVVEHLQQLTALRQLAVAGKVAALLERLDAHREEGRKAIVFCGFVQEGLNRVEEGLRRMFRVVSEAPFPFVRITGAESAEARQAEVDRFQNDPQCLFALCSTTAAGVGITLTAADTVYFLDLPWTPGAKAQAEARAHRIGQHNSVQVVHLLGRGSVDEAMMGVLRNKATVIAQAVDGQAAPVSEGDIAREVSERLAGETRRAAE